VTRSNSRPPVGRTRRPLVVGALAATAAVATVLLSACGSGRLAQTAEVRPGVPGANVQAAGRAVFVRNATVDYSGPRGYQQGQSAPLSVWIVNDTQEPVRLVGVSANEITPSGQMLPVQVVPGTGQGSAAPCVPAASNAPGPLPSTTASGGAPVPPGSASASATPSGSASASASASASPSSSPSPSAPATISVTVPSAACVELSTRADQYLKLTDLPAPLGNQQLVRAVFRFTTAGGDNFAIGDSTPVDIPVDSPESALPRQSG